MSNKSDQRCPSVCVRLAFSLGGCPEPGGGSPMTTAKRPVTETRWASGVGVCTGAVVATEVGVAEAAVAVAGGAMVAVV